MPALSPEQLAYVERRRRQIRYWPWMALLLTLVLGGLYFWLWTNVPLFLDPQALVEGARDGSLDLSELTVLAALGNLAFLGCGLLILVILLLTSAALWNERRLIAYLDVADPAAGAPRPAVIATREEAGEPDGD